MLHTMSETQRRLLHHDVPDELRSVHDLLCDQPDAELLGAVKDNRHDKELLRLLDAELRRSSHRIQLLREH